MNRFEEPHLKTEEEEEETHLAIHKSHTVHRILFCLLVSA